MEQTIKYGDKTIDDRFVLGKLLIETNFRGYVVEKNETWGYSLFKVEHKSDINSDRLYLIVEDLTEEEIKIFTEIEGNKNDKD